MIPDVFPQTCQTCKGVGTVENPTKPPTLFGVIIELFVSTEVGEIPIKVPKTIRCPKCKGEGIILKK